MMCLNKIWTKVVFILLRKIDFKKNFSRRHPITRGETLTSLLKRISISSTLM